MNNKRKSFIIHIDSLEILDKLTDEQAGKLFRAIKAHHAGEELELDLTTDLIFTPFKSQFDRDDEKYSKIVERNKNNGLKGGRPKTQEIPEESKKPTGLSGNPEEPKKADSDSGNDSDNDSGNKDNKPMSPIGDVSPKKPKSKKIELDESRIVELWNSLGCVRHNMITKTARASIEKSYKEYCKATKQADKEPLEATEWILGYLKSGFAKWMTDHHRQLNDGQWAADLEFAMRPATYEKVKSTIVTNRTKTGLTVVHNDNQPMAQQAGVKLSPSEKFRQRLKAQGREVKF